MVKAKISTWARGSGHQPIEQVTDREEPLLDARRRELAPQGDRGGEAEYQAAGTWRCFALNV
jgi:hypothetical protein